MIGKNELSEEEKEGIIKEQNKGVQTPIHYKKSKKRKINV